MTRALQAGIDRGELRGDLDLEACCDLLTGVFYYQLIVRGEALSDPEVMQRCHNTISIALRGMSADA